MKTTEREFFILTHCGQVQWYSDPGSDRRGILFVTSHDVGSRLAGILGGERRLSVAIVGSSRGESLATLIEESMRQNATCVWRVDENLNFSFILLEDEIPANGEG